MVFSSTVFLFLFLVVALLVYYGVLRKRSHRNVFLMLMSLLFYAWGEPWFVFVMLGSIAMNWYAGLLIDRYRADKKKAKSILTLCVVLNLGLLFVFKYTGFIMRNLNLLVAAELPNIVIMLPIGISFFTFQAMSYVIDVYRGDGVVQKKFMNVCLYVSLFPQLIAGPIVRYQTVADELTDRRENVADFNAGVRRFVIGFCKKVLLANNLALLADAMFKTPVAEITTANAWLGDLAYSLQVFYDFAGYSDMAIGLGLMFGFHFLENFNYPYISKSISEFWRRWHMSLGSWFRDYLYIPLGGSHCSRARWIFNMFMVWSLTGLWHGAEWTYVVWGLCFFVVLVIEKMTHMEQRWNRWIWLRYVYALFIIMLTSVIIRSETLPYAIDYLKCMFGIGGSGLWDISSLLNLRENAYFLAFGILFSMPVGVWLKKKLHVSDALSTLISNGLLFIGFVVAVSYVVQGSYNPFIYFNF